MGISKDVKPGILVASDEVPGSIKGRKTETNIPDRPETVNNIAVQLTGALNYSQQVNIRGIVVFFVSRCK